MNSDIPSENDLIRKYCEQSPKASAQSETSEDGKNGFLKIFLNLSEFSGF
jgi:hypothetical protein